VNDPDDVTAILAELRRRGDGARPPASAASLERLGAALDAAVPAPILALYRAFDGTPPSGSSLPMRLLSVDEAVALRASTRSWVPAIAGLRFFFTDGQSGLAGVAVSGPVAGTVATAIQGRPSYAPRFRSAARFLTALLELDEDDDWEEMRFDYPATRADAIDEAVDEAADDALVQRLERWTAGGPDARAHRVACLLAVVPPSQAGRLVAHVDDPDDQLADAACAHLGKLGFAAAVPRLLDVAFGDRGVPAGAAVGALMTIGKPAIAPTLARLASGPVSNARAAASILDRAGVDVREHEGRWQYREGEKAAWRAIPEREA